MLEFRWGTDVIRLELAPEGDGTKLTLFDTIDGARQGRTRRAGWHVCLDQLEHHLDGTRRRGRPAIAGASVHPSYVEELGAEAATIGPPAGALD